MSDDAPPTPPPAPYRVSYSEAVRQRILKLAENARSRGDSEQFLAALKEMHRRLCLYPQFGEPLRDLTHEVGQVWIGIVPPIALRYVVLDERRIVMVVETPVLLPKMAR